MSLYFDKGANRSLSNLDAAGEEKFTDKQDTLVSGENIKTINGVSVLGEGNIEVGEGGTITVNQTYDPTSSYAQSGTAVAEGLLTVANKDLSNLSSNGQMIIDSQNGTISNCILEIPQNIKLTLESNVVTVKSGSILTDSGSVYQTITLVEDKTIQISNIANLKRVIFATSSGTLSQVTVSGCVSGNTDSKASEAYHIWFDTSNKEVNYYGSDGTTASHRTYPLCIVETDSNGVASFAKDSNGNDMIFNGEGFIGHHAFVYPNVKALLPNGFNEDGSLKSVSTTTNTLIITELNKNATAVWITNDGISTGYSELEELPPNPINYFSYYIKSQNRLMIYNGISWAQRNRTMAVGYSTVNNIVTDFAIRQPYEGARNLLTDDLEEEVATKQADVTTLTGYDSTQTQTLKNINGVLTWVTD